MADRISTATEIIHVERLLSFGVLTDVQYADREDHISWYSADKMRYYRSSLDHVRKAMNEWTNGKERVSFVMQLGDLVDASNRTLGLDSELAFRRCLDTLSQSQLPIYHVIGNHEVDTFQRSKLAEYNFLKGAKEQEYHYYSFRPADNVVVIVLDCFEVSLLGQHPQHPNYQKAQQILSQHHSSVDPSQWELDDHLVDDKKRFVSYNGALSKLQIQWLEEQLAIADFNGHHVILCGHLSLLASSSHWTCVCWNGDEVLDVVHRYKCVVVYLCGHFHDTGYAVDKHGIHHVTLGGIIEVPPDETSFSTVHVYTDRLEIVGFGREKSYVLNFRKHESAGKLKVDQNNPL
ncbi:hypothetical protein CHUAL_003089 [Chamberlinius hualienensis]